MMQLELKKGEIMLDKIEMLRGGFLYWASQFNKDYYVNIIKDIFESFDKIPNNNFYSFIENIRIEQGENLILCCDENIVDYGRLCWNFMVAVIGKDNNKDLNNLHLIKSPLYDIKIVTIVETDVTKYELLLTEEFLNQSEDKLEFMIEQKVITEGKAIGELISEFAPENSKEVVTLLFNKIQWIESNNDEVKIMLKR